MEEQPAVTDIEKDVTGGSSSVKSFLSGGFGGICLVLVGHPFDLIKVKLQTGTAYKGALDVAVKTFKAEGAVGFYRGVSAPLTGISPTFAICFWGYDMGMRIVRSAKGMGANEELSLVDKSIAGALSAFPTTVLTAPVERVKCLLQIQNHQPTTTGQVKYTGMVDCAKKLLKEGGISSLYKGWQATLLRDVPGSVAYFGVNAALKQQFTGTDGQISSLGILTAGGIAGMANWAIAIPPDVLKSRQQTAPEGMYSGVLDVYRKLMRTEGPRALFKGVGPAMVRAFPANAACFFGVDVATHFLNRLGL
jgi:solute carrier family 25 carnitine/acylcarnitine transporter 20/29